MQTSKNAFELFPADQFDAWVDGVRSKIIDGLERQHLPGGSQVRVPELSSKALEAIEAARRDEELTRQAIASSSSLADRMDVVKDTDGIVEVTEEVTTTTVVAEYEEAYNGGYGNAAGLEDPDSRYVSGSQNCPLAQVAALNFFETEKFKETEAANADLFKKLNIDWLEGTLPEAYL